MPFEPFQGKYCFDHSGPVVAEMVSY